MPLIIPNTFAVRTGSIQLSEIDDNFQYLATQLTPYVDTTSSGTYTPTAVSTNTNVASVTFSECQYMRVGLAVTVSGQLAITATTAATDTIVKISLPIASNFSASRNLAGVGSSLTTPYAVNNIAIMADATNDCVELRLRPSVNTALNYNFSFTYRII